MRSIQGYSRDPRLLELLPGRWQRVWEGQLYDVAAPGQGQGQGALAAPGGLEFELGGEEGPEVAVEGGEESIEESESEDDW